MAWSRITFRASLMVPHKAGDLDDAIERFCALMDIHSYMEVEEYEVETIGEPEDPSGDELKPELN
jgi:hypothetical protein